MTYARWRQDGFDADFVAAELEKNVSPLPTGGLNFSGTAFFDDPLIVLKTGVEFLVPISDADRSRIINDALEPALRSDDYGPRALIREINEAARDFYRKHESSYVLATGLSFKHFEDISRMESSGCRLYVRQELPRRFVKSRKEALLRSRTVVRGDYPEDVPYERYAAAWLHVRGRSPTEAVDRAVEALDLRRGIWNLALNRGMRRLFPPPNRGPVNNVLAGPLYSLHNRDGSLATDYDWYEPDYSGPRVSRKVAQRWGEIYEDEKGIRQVLKRCPYRPSLEDALRRYCRALDSADLYRAFLELWGLLETLTGLRRNEGHDKVVRRASFIFADEQRKTHEQVLHHLRRYRNSYAHAGEGSDQVGAYLQQVRYYVEKMLIFHFWNSSHFSSLDRAADFLDLPTGRRDLRCLIETRQQQAAEAADDARLAEEGLRFRKES